MASIKISALGELVLDRLSDTDNLIINDENTTTQRVTYKTIRDGLDRDARYFTGPVEFGNTVIFNGPLGGRNVYTKDETLFEINAAVAPVEAKVLASETDIEALRRLAGIDRVSGIIPPTYIGGTFTSAVVPGFSAGPLSIVGAVNAIGSHLENVAATLTSLTASITANGVLIGANTVDIAALDGRVELLETAVFSASGNADGIAANGSLIAGNTSNITAIVSCVGVQVGHTNLGDMSPAVYCTSNSTVKNSLKKLDAQAVAEDARVTEVIADLTNTDKSVVTASAQIQAIVTAIDTAAAALSSADPAKGFADALAQAVYDAVQAATPAP